MNYPKNIKILSFLKAAIIENSSSRIINKLKEF